MFCFRDLVRVAYDIPKVCILLCDCYVGELEAKTWSSLQLLTCQCRSLPTQTGSFGNKHLNYLPLIL